MSSDKRDSVVSLEYDVVWKVVLVGNSGVGKTNFLTRYAWNQFSQSSKPTIGIDFANKDITHEDKKIRLQIWDTAGQERYRALANLYYSGALAVIILYDMTNHITFQDVTRRWLSEIKQQCGLRDPVVMLIGNKLDLRHLRAVSTEEGMEMAENHSMLFIEASACDDHNVNEAFDLIVNAVAARQKVKSIESLSELDDNKIKLSQKDQKKKTKANCCRS